MTSITTVAEKLTTQMSLSERVCGLHTLITEQLTYEVVFRDAVKLWQLVEFSEHRPQGDEDHDRKHALKYAI
jgi:hypothetical protein